MNVPARLKLIGATLLFTVLTVNMVRSTMGLLKNNRRLDDSRDEIKRLESKKAYIEEQISYKKTQEYIEERARNDLNLVKPNEQVYVVIGDKSSVLKQRSAVLGTQNEDDNRGNWYQWYRLFF